jgi:hypothetical protein
MISLLWLFVGALAGLLIVSVFTPPPRIEEGKPEPGKENKFNTPLGCVNLVAKEVPCE